MPKKSNPSWSAKTPSSTRFRIVWAWESGRPSTSLVLSPNVSRPKVSGNAISILLCHLGPHRGLELGPMQGHAEDWAAGFQDAAGAEAVQADGGVAHAFDHVCHHLDRTAVVARDAQRATLRRARGPAVFRQLVVADRVERPDGRRHGAR